MKSKISNSLKDLAASRVGLLLVVINFLLLLYCYHERDRKSEPFHYFYESTLLKILIFINVPPFLFVSIPFWEMGFTEDVGEKYLIIKLTYFISLFLAVIFQWLLIGYIIEKTYNNLKRH